MRAERHSDSEGIGTPGAAVTIDDTTGNLARVMFVHPSLQALVTVRSGQTLVRADTPDAEAALRSPQTYRRTGGVFVPR